MEKDKSLIKLGKNIKGFRKMRNLTQKELGELCGLHRTYMGAVERGERNLSTLALCKVAKVLGVEVQDLVK